MKKEKAIQILKDYIGIGPEAEPVQFDKAIATAIKYLETKPYLAEDMDKRVMLALKLDREKKEYIIGVFLDDQLFFNIWCDRISVYGMRPPTYCLYAGGINIVGIAAKLMTISPEAKDIIPEATLAALGNYVKIEEAQKNVKECRSRR